MGRHSPGEGMTPVAALLDVPAAGPEVDWPGADEDYADELREMRAAIAEDAAFERTQDAATRYQEHPEGNQ